MIFMMATTEQAQDPDRLSLEGLRVKTLPKDRAQHCDHRHRGADRYSREGMMLWARREGSMRFAQASYRSAPARDTIVTDAS